MQELPKDHTGGQRFIIAKGLHSGQHGIQPLAVFSSIPSRLFYGLEL